MLFNKWGRSTLNLNYWIQAESAEFSGAPFLNLTGSYLSACIYLAEIDGKLSLPPGFYQADNSIIANRTANW
jgi:hypothetical protein